MNTYSMSSNAKISDVSDRFFTVHQNKVKAVSIAVDIYSHSCNQRHRQDHIMGF